MTYGVFLTNEGPAPLFSGIQLEMLDGESFEEATGGPVGYCGPAGAKAGLKIVADESLKDWINWTVGGNKRDTHLSNAVPGRDFELSAFADFTTVVAGDPCSNCGTALEIFRGIEVGHIFKLGTKYSEAMNCVFLDEKGERNPMIMGCYGLGIGRTVAAAIEQNHDDDGIDWPVPIAPFEVVVLTAGKDEAITTMAERIYDQLLGAGVDVIYDDRDERPGVKFKDADLIGFPLRIVIGAKGLATGQVEWSTRHDREKRLDPPAAVVAEVITRIEQKRSGLPE